MLIAKGIDYIYFETDYIDLENCKTEKEEFFATMLKKDKRFYDYYLAVKSIKKVYEAGFFIEHIEAENDDFKDFFPKAKYLSNYKSDTTNVILLTCGAFSPLHLGHIEMMNLAKQELENRNYNVCGGIISPSHDDYVDLKRNGESRMFVLDRVNEAENLIHSTRNDWLTLDIWEGYYAKQSLNFTTVIDRLDRVLNDTDKQIKIVFVFGGDNHDFRYVFKEDELSICVNRNHTSLGDKKEFEHHELNIVLEGTTANWGKSSTSTRKLGYQLKEVETTNYYEVRNDGYLSTEYLGVTKEQADTIYTKLSNIIQKNVINNPTILEVNIDKQLKLFKEKYEGTIQQSKIISSDIYIKGDYPISVSREFKYLEGQVQSCGLVNRQGNKLETFPIPSGSYYIVDDDIASGFTMTKIKENLPADVKVLDCIGLNDLVRDKEKVAFDIVDVRDFIIGAKHGGLQVAIGTDVIRVPYLFPYVNLYYRACVQSDKQLQFTIDILKLNLEIYAELKDVKVADLEGNKEWLQYLNYDLNDTVLSVLEKELEKMYKI